MNDLGVSLMREGITARHGGTPEREYRVLLVRSLACFEDCLSVHDGNTAVCRGNKDE